MPKYLHLADLHLGRRLREYSLYEEQQDVLEQAIQVVDAQHCDEVLIAGDVYDKATPSVEAMALFDDFITKLCERRIPVSVISGNHDAAGRISYFSKLLEQNGVSVSTEFQGVLQPVKPADAPVQIWLMPFLTPARVRGCYPNELIRTYEDAVRVVLRNSPLDKSKVNILLAHQFITGGIKTEESEEYAVGGLDNINAELFADFDYVALGHLHAPQSCGRPEIRYAGSPLKYSLSEEHQKKTFTIVTIQDKTAKPEIQEIPIRLLHDVRTVRGTFAELMKADRTEDYIRVLLTDETVPPDARIMLRSNFPRMLRFGVDNPKIQQEWETAPAEMPEQQSPVELFCEFYAMQNNQVAPSEEQLAIVQAIFTELEEEERQ